jgi:hypothetical protein
LSADIFSPHFSALNSQIFDNFWAFFWWKNRQKFFVDVAVMRILGFGLEEKPPRNSHESDVFMVDCHPRKT